MRLAPGRVRGAAEQVEKLAHLCRGRTSSGCDSAQHGFEAIVDNHAFSGAKAGTRTRPGWLPEP
jgi:hypothetical protein